MLVSTSLPQFNKRTTEYWPCGNVSEPYTAMALPIKSIEKEAPFADVVWNGAAADTDGTPRKVLLGSQSPK